MQQRLGHWGLSADAAKRNGCPRESEIEHEDTHRRSVGQRKNPRVVAAALVAAGAVAGWAMSTTITANATAFEDLARIEAPREKLPLEASKPSLIGSYVVTGGDGQDAAVQVSAIGGRPSRRSVSRRPATSIG
jgi:hypothetical protein